MTRKIALVTGASRGIGAAIARDLAKDGMLAAVHYGKRAGAIYTLCTAVGEFFYHTSVRAPRWIGYVFQRPEMHRIHHRYGRHKTNYGDIVWWDMLFGTYENPREWRHTCGFDEAREQQLLRMLAYQDVHRDRAAP